MLICHCNVITSRDIEAIVRDLLHDDPWQIIVPAKVYRELDKRCKCSGCVPSVVDVITRVTAQYHREIAEVPAGEVAPSSPVPQRRKLQGGPHEGRNKGHRAA